MFGGAEVRASAPPCQEAPAEPEPTTGAAAVGCCQPGRQYGPFSWWSRTWSHTAYIWDTGGTRKRRKTGCYTTQPGAFSQLSVPLILEPEPSQESLRTLTESCTPTRIISSTSVKMRQFIRTITERSAATDEKLLTLLAGVPVVSYERRGL